MPIPEGVIAAMLTPFNESGRVNEGQVRKLVNFLIDKGVDGIFPVSSSGEYVHMDIGERKLLIDIVVDEARDRVDIIPGTGATCYHQSIELATYAKDKGCSAIVLHGPYFFNNSEDAVEGHLRKVAESVDIPIFLYNIPFFANEVTPHMAETLCRMSNVVGIKDSSGNMINVMNLIEMTRKVNPDFRVLVGVEEIMLPALLMGGKGAMTATAGIVPEFMTGIYKAYKDGNSSLAFSLQFAILPLIRDMKSFNFPQGFKEALATRGIEMGLPKMIYPKEALNKLSDLKERLKLEIESVLEKHFPGTSVIYRYEGKTSENSYR
jgi:dihydrodipicolinate synthase/N-acetylneuraminate lyase